MVIKLNDYKLEPTFMVGQPECEKVLEYRFTYQDNSYLVEVELDFQNVPLICLFELDDCTVKYAGDNAENLFLVFNKMEITENELIHYCNKWLMEVAHVAFQVY